MVVSLYASTRGDLLPGSLASNVVCSGHAWDPQLVVVGEGFFWGGVFSFFFLKYVMPFFNV